MTRSMTSYPRMSSLRNIDDLMVLFGEMDIELVDTDQANLVSRSSRSMTKSC